MIINVLNEAAESAGVKVQEWAILNKNAVNFSPQMLDYCKANVCGNYNKSWTCPPACESPEEQQKKITSCKEILIFTTKHDLEDSFDLEGMEKGRMLHSLLTMELKKLMENPMRQNIHVFGAGNCPVCETCVFPKPCPFPEKKIGSIEAAGINVTELSAAAGITYNNGPDTVTFFSMILINE
ncbi:MAG: DUF2284 domain-containing protein [Treponema sp.]|nr:DUF2284 domain-containing protein [Treponema sp.]